MIPKTVPVSTILEFLLGYLPEAIIIHSPYNNEIIIQNWNDPSPQPTDQEIINAGNDLTTVNGQVFSEWYAEHGGDPILTLRREAQEALDAQNSRIEALIRALALVTMDEINVIRADSAINLPERTAEQLRTAIKTKIGDGDADT
jgi:hypothetical protein